MTNQHPLTDEMCYGMRVGYSSAESMRAAADWQLEADAEWWRTILNEAEFLPPHGVDYIIEEFKQAMRPQADELDRVEYDGFSDVDELTVSERGDWQISTRSPGATLAYEELPAQQQEDP